MAWWPREFRSVGLQLAQVPSVQDAFQLPLHLPLLGWNVRRRILHIEPIYPEVLTLSTITLVCP